jgi:type IV secretory pathway VirB10-like protein
MITAEFKDFEEMMGFARNLVSTVETQDKPPVQQTAPAMTQPVQQVAPATPQPVQTQQTTPMAAPVQQTAPVAPPPVQQAPVQTTAPSYTPDDLARAAMTLMDSGRQGDLIDLLAQFGADTLTHLQPEQYGAFATALRGLGAPI